MKKFPKVLILILCIALGLCAFAACDSDKRGEIPDGKVRVTFYDGTAELSHSDIDAGGKVTKPEDPSKSGYDFVGWFKTPAFDLAFDFDDTIDENTSVFAGYRSQAADNHTWFILGESIYSDLFKEVGWKDISQGTSLETLPASVTMVKDATIGNKFTLRADFYKDDKFQIVNTVDGWGGQIGYGYITASQYSTDKTSDFYVAGLGLGGTAKKANFVCGRSGNYTITLMVDADGKLTEVSYFRNGDAAKLPVQFNYYIKGQYVTAWQNMYVEYTKFDSDDEKKVYTLEIGMKEGDKFMFMAEQIGEDVGAPASLNNKSFEVSTDEKTAAALNLQAEGNNFVTKADGLYLFTITEIDDETRSFKAEKKSDTIPEYDYYIKGSMNNDSNWEQRYEMTAANGKYTYEASFAADDQFQVVVVTKDGDPTDEDAVVLKSGVGTAYADKVNISNQIDIAGPNFKVKSADTFTVTIDPTSMLVSIEGTKDTVTWAVSIYGKVNGATNWVDGGNCEIRTDAAALTGSFTQELKAGDEFGFRTCKNGQQKGWANAAAAEGYTYTGCAGLTGTGNITVETAGTYKFDVVINADGTFVSVTASVVTA